MSGELKVVIGADVSQGVAGINQFNTALARIKPGAAQATTSLSNMARVVQDAPFGFIAISNNIDPLLQSFQQLKKETGSTAGAFKSLAAGLLGGGGVALAVSIVTSLLTHLALGSRGAKKEIDSLSDSHKNLADFIEDANKSAGEELARLTVLNKVATDTSASMQTRVNAVQALKREFPDYLASVRAEAILNGQAAEQINLAKDAIIAKAKAEAASKKIAEISSKLLDVEIQLQKTEVSRINARIQYDNQLKKTQKDEVRGMAAVNTATVFYQGQLQKTTNEVESLRETQKKLNAELDTFVDLAGTSAKGAPKDFFKLPDIKVPKAKAQIDELELRAARVGLTFSEMLIEKSTIEKAVGRSIDTSKLKLPPVVLPFKIEGNLDLAILLEKMAEAARLAEDAVNLLGGAFQNMFETIFNGGQNALQALGDAIKQVVVRMAAAAATAALLAGIISAITGTPFSVNFKSIFSKLSGLPKFAEGGIVTKPTLGIFGEAGPEAVVPLNSHRVNGLMGGGGGELTGTLTAQGDKLVALITRVNNRQNKAY